MRFISMKGIRSMDTLNEQMRCAMRATYLLTKQRPEQKNAAAAIGKSENDFSSWICHKKNFTEDTLQALLDYLKSTHSSHIDFIMRIAEELYNYERRVV